MLRMAGSSDILARFYCKDKFYGKVEHLFCCHETFLFGRNKTVVGGAGRGDWLARMRAQGRSRRDARGDQNFKAPKFSSLFSFILAQQK